MKRDFDLVRMILIEVQRLDAGQLSTGMPFEQYDASTVTAHVVLLIEAGLLDGTVLKLASGHPRWQITGLTWAGHDFVDTSNKPGLWDRAKETVIKPSGGVAFSVLLEWMKTEAVAAITKP